MDRNESFWAATIQGRPARVLEQGVRADIAIVGAGLLGVSSAYDLKKLFPDKQIVLIEAARVANGASGRNGGAVLAMTGCAPEGCIQAGKAPVAVKEDDSIGLVREGLVDPTVGERLV